MRNTCNGVTTAATGPYKEMLFPHVLSHGSELHLGIPHAARASAKLFTMKTLRGSPGSYPALSQKILKGFLARMGSSPLR